MTRTPEHKRAGFTKPQWELLCEIVDGNHTLPSPDYEPREYLERFRLIRLEINNRTWEHSLVATDAGKCLVKNIRAEHAAAVFKGAE